MTQARRTNSRLAAYGHLRQVEAVLRADRAADACTAIVGRAWQGVLRALAPSAGLDPTARLLAVRHALAGLAPALRSAIAAALEDEARRSHRAAVLTLRRVLPRRMAAAALVRRRRAVPEAIDWEDMLAPWRGEDEPEGDLWSLLFPPLAAALVGPVIYATGWRDRLGAGLDPDVLAAGLYVGLSAGEGPRELARRLLPAVGGVESAARRVARTEAMRVAGAAQMQAHAQLGDLVVGWQVHATLDQNTRSWHAARSGAIYYRNPAPGQKGLAQCPHPPEEAADPRERPPGTPAIAPNCRCYLTPVLRDPGDPSLTAALSQADHPDPLVYTDWWAAADEQRKRLAVGTRRYAAVAELLGAAPDWEHFVADDGRLLRMDELRKEGPADRAVRVASVRAALSQRRRDAARVSRLGY